MLDGVAQLVCDELAALSGLWLILTCGKYRVLTSGVGRRIDGSCRFFGARPGMDAHIAEIVAETRLEESTRIRIEWLARRAQLFMNNGRRFGGHCPGCGLCAWGAEGSGIG